MAVYRWSGKFSARDAGWVHMERQLVDYELIVMEKGTLYLEDETGQYEVSKGEYLLMKPTQRQKGYKPSRCSFYWMHFFPQDCDEKILSEIGKKGSLKNVSRIYLMMKQLQDADLRYMDSMYNDHFAGAILCEIAAQMVCYTAETEGEDVQFRQKAEEYLVENMHKSISVGDMAAAFGYHEKYFSTLFKEKTGKSVKQYLDEYKMERAGYLLLNTDGRVSEIADHLGYSDVQNFYHVFKRTFDCTPSEFRWNYCESKENHQ